MKLLLSASAIKDFIACPQRFYYRIFKSGAAIKSKKMAMGTIIHGLLEKPEEWNTVEEGLELAKKRLKEDNVETIPEDFDGIGTALENYLGSFKYWRQNATSVEESFQIPFSANTSLIGRFDMINTKDRWVADWKFTETTPRKISNDPQFILYDHAFSVLQKETPLSVIYINLLHNKIVPYNREDAYYNELLHQIIPHIESVWTSKQYYRRGLYEYVKNDSYRICNSCPFKAQCWGEFYELDSGRLSDM